MDPMRDPRKQPLIIPTGEHKSEKRAGQREDFKKKTVKGAKNLKAFLGKESIN